MILSGLISIFIVFLFLRLLLGMSEGINFPVINKIVTNWYNSNEHAKGISVSLVGVPLACLIGGPIISFLIVKFEWWGAFVILGIASIIFCLIFMLIFKSTPNNHICSEFNEGVVKKSGFIRLKFCLTNKMLLVNYFATFAFGYLLFFYLTWLPGFLMEKLNINLSVIGLYTSIPWAVASISVILGGFFSQFLLKKTQSKRIAYVHLFWILMLFSSISVAMLLFSSSLFTILTMVSLALGFCFAANSLFFSICRDIKTEYVGTATGIAITFFSMSGIISPYMTGILRDLSGSFDSGIILLSVIMIIAALLLIIFCKPDKMN